MVQVQTKDGFIHWIEMYIFHKKCWKLVFKHTFFKRSYLKTDISMNPTAIGMISPKFSMKKKSQKIWIHLRFVIFFVVVIPRYWLCSAVDGRRDHCHLWLLWWFWRTPLQGQTRGPLPKRSSGSRRNGFECRGSKVPRHRLQKEWLKKRCLALYLPS